MYENNGKQVFLVSGSTRLHIADAVNEEFAIATVEKLNHRGNYIANAKRTLSPSWHGDKVDLLVFKKALNEAIAALNDLDKIKKSIFYGRDNNLTSLGRQNCNLIVDGRAPNVHEANVIHGIIGKATESGELLEALHAFINGEPLDAVNVKEEVGDGFWYDAILLSELGGTFEEVQDVNIAKLRARFPEKFDSVNANERDLATERAILEGSPLPPGFIDLDEAIALGLQPAIPASGVAQVSQARHESEVAFDRVQNVGNAFVDQTGGEQSGELHLSPAARKHPLPGENLAHQPIDPRKK